MFLSFPFSFFPFFFLFLEKEIYFFSMTSSRFLLFGKQFTMLTLTDELWYCLVTVTHVALLLSSSSNAEQFNRWYGFYSVTLRDIAGPNCYANHTIGEFPELAKYSVPNRIDICRAMSTCLLRNLSDFDKADMQSATIVLGLMPTILAYLGPTVGVLALLSSRASRIRRTGNICNPSF